MKTTLAVLALAALTTACATTPAVTPAAATAPQSAESKQLYDQIARLDAELFGAYNAHDASKVRSYFAEDLEFFHDTGGLLTLDMAMGGLTSNFGKDNGIRRDLVPGSLEVYPIRGYGAIQVGEHTFCHKEEGQDDCGTFKFVHVWQNNDGKWQITRAVSYDH